METAPQADVKVFSSDGTRSALGLLITGTLASVFGLLALLVLFAQPIHGFDEKIKLVGALGFFTLLFLAAFLLCLPGKLEVGSEEIAYHSIFGRKVLMLRDVTIVRPVFMLLSASITIHTVKSKLILLIYNCSRSQLRQIRLVILRNCLDLSIHVSGARSPSDKATKKEAIGIVAFFHIGLIGIVAYIIYEFHHRVIYK